jgi:hypothetical protein
MLEAYQGLKGMKPDFSQTALWRWPGWREDFWNEIRKHYHESQAN